MCLQDLWFIHDLLEYFLNFILSIYNVFMMSWILLVNLQIYFLSRYDRWYNVVLDSICRLTHQHNSFVMGIVGALPVRSIFILYFIYIYIFLFIFVFYFLYFFWLDGCCLDTHFIFYFGAIKKHPLDATPEEGVSTQEN